MGYSLRKAGAANAAECREAIYNEALRIDPKHRGALEYSGELYLMTGNLPKAEQRLAALDKACFLPCEEYTRPEERGRTLQGRRQQVRRATGKPGDVPSRCTGRARTATASPRVDSRARGRRRGGRYWSQSIVQGAKPMNLIARARWLLRWDSRRAARPRIDSDPADMGTAFGLDAITTLEPESPAEIAAARRRAAAVEPLRATAAPPLDASSLAPRASPRRRLRRRGPAAAGALRPRRAARGRASCRRPGSSRRHARPGSRARSAGGRAARGRRAAAGRRRRCRSSPCRCCAP